jgi:GH35 family endo-1,4-beta-xylanase
LKFGVTFSEPYALDLGLRPGEAFRALIRDIGLKVVRLCAYWDQIEPQPDNFDFTSLDWQVREAETAGVEIILALGQKAPRWPEYHLPSWAARDAPGYDEHVVRMVAAVVSHFRDAPVRTWQIENEPYLAFGGPAIEESLLVREIQAVRRVDDRPIMLTDSADKGNWGRAAKWCDVLGVNLYTRVWNGHRYVDIDVPASRYRAKISDVEPLVTHVMVSELQAEPWGPRPVTQLTPSEAALTMDPARLRRNVDLAVQAGFETVLFWGGEWWYWLRERGDSRMWETARSVVEERASGFR